VNIYLYTGARKSVLHCLFTIKPNNKYLSRRTKTVTFRGFLYACIYVNVWVSHYYWQQGRFPKMLTFILQGRFPKMLTFILHELILTRGFTAAYAAFEFASQLWTVA